MPNTTIAKPKKVTGSGFVLVEDTVANARIAIQDVIDKMSFTTVANVEDITFENNDSLLLCSFGESHPAM